VLGVLNLRGAVVPIIDTRVRFGLQAAEFTAVTVVIVLSLHIGKAQRECGIVVDQVLDVVDVTDDRIKPAPTTHGSAAGECIEGIVTLDEQMLILLKAESLVCHEPTSNGIADRAA
jgi:purine-binding chemotaxis protein CheW